MMSLYLICIAIFIYIDAQMISKILFKQNIINMDISQFWILFVTLLDW